MKTTVNREEWINGILTSANNLEKQNPSTNVFKNVIAEINSETDRISLTWIRVVAAVFIFMVSVELSIVSQTNKEDNPFTEIIPVNDNILYYE